METKRISLVSKQYTLPFILVTSLFFLWGFAHAILDVLNSKHSKKCTFYTLRFGCSFAAVNTIKPQLL